ncbi:helix-turn-helix domain-containing protein [Aquisalimonas lutea]|uniref:helix-turn-helix domain-containing protein n=1 Tax=Aquisalimonas lutea TaxID=1327750 RepID=UPI0025B32DB4|nr:helix-turn-helix domain-containing protein [Aquisalimonas lutea]MDN3518164.1 helix-turn-helix domain-containing protein [Aquisalimonas lutea]
MSSIANPHDEGKQPTPRQRMESIENHPDFSTLTKSELNVLQAFKSFVLDNSGEAHPAVATLAEKAGVSRATTKRALSKLHRLGFVVVVSEGGRVKGGQRRATVRRLEYIKQYAIEENPRGSKGAHEHSNRGLDRADLGAHSGNSRGSKQRTECQNEPPNTLTGIYGGGARADAAVPSASCRSTSGAASALEPGQEIEEKTSSHACEENSSTTTRTSTAASAFGSGSGAGSGGPVAGSAEPATSDHPEGGKQPPMHFACSAQAAACHSRTTATGACDLPVPPRNPDAGAAAPGPLGVLGWRLGRRFDTIVLETTTCRYAVLPDRRAGDWVLRRRWRVGASDWRTVGKGYSTAGLAALAAMRRAGVVGEYPATTAFDPDDPDRSFVPAPECAVVTEAEQAQARASMQRQTSTETDDSTEAQQRREWLQRLGDRVRQRREQREGTVQVRHAAEGNTPGRD